MTKNQYQAMISMYRKRREDYKKKKYSPEKIKKISVKISNWLGQIRRIEAREYYIQNLIESINEFFDVDIKSRCKDANHNLAQSVFYKYGMENGFTGARLVRSLGRKKTSRASIVRLRFTRSFKTNKKNRDAYHNFKNYGVQSCVKIKPKRPKKPIQNIRSNEMYVSVIDAANKTGLSRRAIYNHCNKEYAIGYEYWLKWA